MSIIFSKELRSFTCGADDVDCFGSLLFLLLLAVVDVLLLEGFLPFLSFFFDEELLVEIMGPLRSSTSSGPKPANSESFGSSRRTSSLSFAIINKYKLLGLRP